MDPDQTAPTEINNPSIPSLTLSDLSPHCLSLRLRIFSGRQKHTFCDYAL